MDLHLNIGRYIDTCLLVLLCHTLFISFTQNCFGLFSPDLPGQVGRWAEKGQDVGKLLKEETVLCTHYFSVF